MKNFFKNIRLGSIADFLILSFCVFLISFAWARFTTHSLMFAIGFSCIAVVGFNGIRFSLNSKKQSKILVKQGKEKLMEESMINLISSTQEDNLELFKNILLAQNADNIIVNNVIVANDTSFIIDFDTKVLTLEKSLRNIKSCIKNGAKKINVLCYSCLSKDKTTLESIAFAKVQVLEKEEVFLKYLDANKMYPEDVISFDNENKKIKIKELLRMGLTKEKSKQYFLSGILIFFCSLIVRYNFYYVFMSSVLFMLAILSRSSRHNEK